MSKLQDFVITKMNFLTLTDFHAFLGYLDFISFHYFYFFAVRIYFSASKNVFIFKRECISDVSEKNVFLFIGDCIFVPAEMYFFPERVYFHSSKNLFLVLRERRPAGDKLLVHRQRQRPHLASILEHPSEHQEHKFSTYFESSAY